MDSPRRFAVPIPVTASAADRRNAIRLRVIVPTEVRTGTTVPVTLVVQNTTDRAVELYVRGRRPAFDIIVRSGDETVWRLLEDAIIPAIVQLLTLAAGEMIEFRASWDQRTARGQPVAAGEYAVQGFLLLDLPPTLESPAVPLRITRA